MSSALETRPMDFEELFIPPAQTPRRMPLLDEAIVPLLQLVIDASVDRPDPSDPSRKLFSLEHRSIIDPSSVNMHKLAPDERHHADILNGTVSVKPDASGAYILLPARRR
jgi:hypothetical protein